MTKAQKRSRKLQRWTKQIARKTARANRVDWNTYNVTELRQMARDRGIPRYSKMRRAELITALS